MKLLWKLLRQHISLPQLTGFFFANLFGTAIVLLGWQFYCDVVPVFTSADSFMKADYLVVSKKIGLAGASASPSSGFSIEEEDSLCAQPFVGRMGHFTSAAYQTEASMWVNGTRILNSELFFESLPDDFVDASPSVWHYAPGSSEVPVILPRSYITMYNFGFAQSHSLPKISEGLVSLIDFRIFIRGDKETGQFRGRVIGFSSKLNTILVPQAFMDWSNRRFSTGEPTEPLCLIFEPRNPADERISAYLDTHGYDLEDPNLDAEKTSHFLRLIVSMVMTVGGIISVLSFYVLLLSIYLLVEKNASKLKTLLLLGYSPARVALPYQLLSVGLNLTVLLLSLLILLLVRTRYIHLLETLFPDLPQGSAAPAILVGLALFLLVTVMNATIIRRKIVRSRGVF